MSENGWKTISRPASSDFIYYCMALRFKEKYAGTTGFSFFGAFLQQPLF
jgi:hypothetical protein